MRDACTVAVVVGLVVYTLLFTPPFLSHLSWKRRYWRAYTKTGSNKIYVVSYDHDRVDGALVHHRLRTRAWRLRRLPRGAPPPPQCHLWCTVDTVPHANASPFVRLVAHVLCERHRVLEARGGDSSSSLKSAVLVGTRHRLPPREFGARGCFVRAAFVTTTPAMRYKNIVRAVRASVEEMQASPRLVDTLAERVAMAPCDFIFNKWMLETIERTDGSVLTLVRGGVQVPLEVVLSLYNSAWEVKVVPHKDNKETWTLLCSQR